MNKVDEFSSVQELNVWLEKYDDQVTIKKIFRSPDKIYFIWYDNSGPPK